MFAHRQSRVAAKSSSSNQTQRQWSPGLAPWCQQASSSKRFFSESLRPFSSRSSFIQPKLTVGQPDDKYEQEADEEEELIQPKTAGAVTPEVAPTISSGIQSLQGGGRSLDCGTSINK